MKENYLLTSRLDVYRQNDVILNVFEYEVVDVDLNVVEYALGEQLHVAGGSDWLAAGI